MRDGPRRFPQNSSCSAVLRCRLASRIVFRVRGCHPLWRQFPQASATLSGPARRRSYNPGRGLDRPGLGSCAFARHYLRNHSYFLFLRVLRCFSSPGSPTASWRCGGITAAGFPHSDIRGSQGICPSPRLFAACHVLPRLREPQASPMRPCRLSLISSGPPAYKAGRSCASP